MSKDKEPISDYEFLRFWEHDVEGKMVAALSETPLGKRIIMLEGLGLKINLKSITEKYIDMQGYTLDETGKVSFDEKKMNEIFLTEETIISKELNIDISQIGDINQLTRIINEKDYKENVTKYGIESTMDMETQESKILEDGNSDIKKLYENINPEEVKAFFDNFNTYESSESIKRQLTEDENIGLSEKEAEDALEEVESRAIEVNITNKETTQGIRYLYRLRTAQETRDFNSEESTQLEFNETIKGLKEIFSNFQYKDEITDENGNIDVEKAVEFLDNWEKAKNEAKVFECLSKIQSAELIKLDAKKLPAILVLLAQSMKSDNEINQKLAFSVAKKIEKSSGYNLIDVSKKQVSLELICNLYERINKGTLSIEDAIRENEWNDSTAYDKLNRIDEAIENDLGAHSNSRDKINSDKEEYNKYVAQKENEMIQAFEEIVLEKKCSPEQIIAIFYEFRKRELIESGADLNSIDGRKLGYSKEHGFARVINEYICSRPEQFKEYLLESGDISGKKINGLISEYDFSEINKTGIYETVNSRLNDIDKSKSETLRLRKKLSKKIDSFRGVSRDEISKEDIDDMFAMGLKLDKDGALSYYLIKDLVRIAPQKYKELFVEKSNAENERESGIIPNVISNIGKTNTELPKRNIPSENEVKKERKNGIFEKIRSFFNRFSKKDNTLMLDSKIENKDINDDSSRTTNQQKFDINKRYEINHELALEQTEKHKDARTQETESSRENETI